MSSGRVHSRRAISGLAVAVTAIAGVGLAPAAALAAPTDLFISEYVEGSSNNKAIEIFNGTGAPVNLATGGYLLQVYFNGASTATAFALTGTVASGDVFVFAHSGAAAAILAQADQTTGSGLFNGDDAIVLRSGGAAGTVLDAIGQVGNDPGTEWGTGLTSTADSTLRRPDAAEAGDTGPTDPFDPATSWTGFASDTFDGIGRHPGTGGDPDPDPDPTVLSVGAVQGQTLDTEVGRTDRSPLAPATGNSASGTLYDVRGVITQRTLARTSAGANQYGFFLQSRLGSEDGDPTTSDGIFVFMGGFSTLIGGYTPTVGDEVVLRARVSEFFNLSQLTGASLVTLLASGLGVDTDVAVTDAVPPADLAAADRFWERHEGARLRVRGGSGVTSGRDVFAGTADSEIWLVDRDDPLLDRTDPYARRVFRDPHPLDNQPTPLFDDDNGQRIMLGTTGVKWTAQDAGALLPAARTFDALDGDAYGALSFSFEKYGVQVERAAFTAGADPSANHPPRAANRSEEVAVSTYNVENLYDFRDDPFDGCDFAGNSGCPGVSPPFDYVPADEQEYTDKLAALADQIVSDLHSPDLLLIEEAEDQDICTVTGGALACGATDNADGAPDTLQELAVTIAAGGGPAYAAAYDRDGADDRGITAAFLYRTDRVSLAPVTAGDPVLGATSGVDYRAPALPENVHVQNPKALNAELPADVDRSTGVDGSNVYTRAPQVGRFLVAAAPGAREAFTVWAVANHFSSTPQARVGQRREQAAYGAAIVGAVERSDATARIAYGGDLNVFPRPDEPVPAVPADQLGPLYEAGLHNLWEDLVDDAPAAAYSYVFQGQAQTLDHLFVNQALYGDLIEMRAAHVNADWAADNADDGSRGSSDHDPQVARFRSRASLTVADVAVAEGNSGVTPMTFTAQVSRPLSQNALICATTLGITASAGSDYQPTVSCQTLAAGRTSVTVTVNVRGDRRREPDERLALVVAGVPGLRLADPLAIGTITNDD
jgi:predicted extracellular nuclease